MPRVLEKRERSLGVKLSIRGERCDSPKCALVRRPQRPGQHGKRYRRNLSDFGVQLQEKQKLRFSYGLTNRELGQLLKRVTEKTKSETPEGLLEALEKRLDNVVYRLGFVSSRSVARHLVGHGHFTVNGKRVTTPSYQVRPGDKVAVREASRASQYFQSLPEKLVNYETMPWLTLKKETLEGEMVGKPVGVELPADVSLVVDYYSK